MVGSYNSELRYPQSSPWGWCLRNPAPMHHLVRMVFQSYLLDQLQLSTGAGFRNPQYQALIINGLAMMIHESTMEIYGLSMINVSP